MTATVEVPQHIEALARAGEIRLAGAAVKAEVKAGTMTVAQAFDDPRAGVVPIGLLLVAQRRWGATRMRRVLSLEHISEYRRVRDLTERQRCAIVAALAR